MPHHLLEPGHAGTSDALATLSVVLEVLWLLGAKLGRRYRLSGSSGTSTRGTAVLIERRHVLRRLNIILRVILFVVL